MTEEQKKADNRARKLRRTGKPPPGDDEAEDSEGEPREPVVPDAEQEAQLDKWVELKRAKDYAAADVIRDALRTQGIEPKKARPAPGRENQPKKEREGGKRTGMTEEQKKADNRARKLRRKGKTAKEDDEDESEGEPVVPDAEQEAQLDEWVELVKAKDFVAADAIRETLRAEGIDPNRARPGPGRTQQKAKAQKTKAPARTEGKSQQKKQKGGEESGEDMMKMMVPMLELMYWKGAEHADSAGKGSGWGGGQGWGGWGGGAGGSHKGKGKGGKGWW